MAAVTFCDGVLGESSRKAFLQGSCALGAAAVLGALAPVLAKADVPESDDLAVRLQYLTDYIAICECQYGYAVGLDSKDADFLANEVFDEYIDVSYPSGTVLQDKLGRELGAGIIDGFAEKGINTQHFFTVYRVTIDGDTATAITYMRATHTMEGKDNYIGGGYYRNGFVRTPNGWRIKSVELTNIYREGENFTY